MFRDGQPLQALTMLSPSDPAHFPKTAKRSCICDDHLNWRHVARGISRLRSVGRRGRVGGVRRVRYQPL